MSRRSRSILTAVAAIVVVWLMAWSGYVIAQNTKMTAEKIRRYVSSIDLRALSAAERADALRKLADKINALSLEERRQWRMSGEWRKWFDEMTEEEKAQFIDATLPTGFKQMLNAFEDLPEARRRKTIDDAMRQIYETHALPLDREPGQDAPMYGTNGAPALSPQLEQRLRTIGLKSFYSESSAQTKAELAPLLEEVQRQMENGRAFR